MNKLKSKGIFPSNKDFYDIVINSNYIEEYELLLKLKSLLDIKYLDKKYKSVFISYSFKDAEFAKVLHAFLVLNGINVFLFQIDDPHKSLKSIMSQEIENRERMIFVASENSLKSRGCQFELTQCRQKFKSTWDRIVIPIRIDNYIFEVKDFDIPYENRVEYWKNILFVKESNINDYSDYKTDINFRKFQDEKILSLIKDSLLKI